MPTQTRTSTGTATKVALGIAIGASAAFAAVSLNSSMMNRPMPESYSAASQKMSPEPKVDGAMHCINKCIEADWQCHDAGTDARQCNEAFELCRSVCPVEKELE